MLIWLHFICYAGLPDAEVLLMKHGLLFSLYLQICQCDSLHMRSQMWVCVRVCLYEWRVLGVCVIR